MRSQHDVLVVFTRTSKAADKGSHQHQNTFPPLLNLAHLVFQHKPRKHKHPQTLYLSILQGDQRLVKFTGTQLRGKQ